MYSQECTRRMPLRINDLVQYTQHYNKNEYSSYNNIIASYTLVMIPLVHGRLLVSKTTDAQTYGLATYLIQERSLKQMDLTN